MQEKLIDADGNELFSYSSSHPILRITRPDAMNVPLSEVEFNIRRKKHEKIAREYTNPNDPAELRKQLDQLKAEIQANKAGK